MKRLFLLCFIIISFMQCRSQTENLSPKTFSRIDSLLQQAVDSGWLVGAVGYIQQNGKPVYNKAFGYSDKANKVAMRTDNIFRIASQTKAITSVAVMMLYDEGKLSISDPVSKYIPGFANAKVVSSFNKEDSSYTTVPAKREITIKDLLTHTSGIDYAGIGSEKMRAIYAKAGLHPSFGDDTMHLENMVNLLATMPLVHQPGEKFTYGLNVDVLGRIVEIISKMPLDKFFSTRIFQPLEMKDTYFYLPKDKWSRLVKVYTVDSTSKTIEWSKPMNGFTPDYPKENGIYFAGGAGLSSTVSDYAKVLQMLLNKGDYNGHHLLKPATVALMTSNEIDTLHVGDQDKFGLGFEITTTANTAKTGISEGSFAWGGYFGTLYWADPKRNLVGEMFIQQSPLQHWSTGGDFKKLVYAK